MKKPLQVMAALALLLPLFAVSNAAASSEPRKTLQAFASEEALSAYLRKLAEEERRRDEEERRRWSALHGMPMMLQAPAPAAVAATESVTNVQHAGVDEGGIVKLHGDHLVILRRGRLFTVNVQDGNLKAVAALDAFGPDVEPRGAWYDELLIAGDTVVVIGYSYTRGGTEIGLFDLSREGALRYRATYHLRSNDYYSSRNYASRLIGTKLVFYTPLRLDLGGDPLLALPGMRRWQAGAAQAHFRRIAPASRIYRADQELDPHAGVALHTVTSCELAKPELDCTSTAVIGPPGRVFYVSPSSVFVWASADAMRRGGRSAHAAVFRIPLDGSAPTALKAAGTPVDQFSFLESEDGHLNVLLRRSGRGEGMWGAEHGVDQLAFMRVPLSSFADGSDSAPRSAYRALPAPRGYALQNRYVGPYLIYGAGAGWSRPQPTTQGRVYALRYAERGTGEAIGLAHAVDRVEALGPDAVVIGSDGKDLHFTTLALGARAEAAGRYMRANAAQGETRSHGFFYRDNGNGAGLIGLPLIGAAQTGWRQLRSPSASLLFLHQARLTLSELGTLDASADATGIADACVASCVDWYGNSRPLFVRGRIFALLGYEIVEGVLSDGGIAELRRVSYAPHWVQQRQ